MERVTFGDSFSLDVAAALVPFIMLVKSVRDEGSGDPSRDVSFPES